MKKSIRIADGCAGTGCKVPEAEGGSGMNRGLFGVNQFGPLATIRMAVENGKF